MLFKLLSVVPVVFCLAALPTLADTATDKPTTAQTSVKSDAPATDITEITVKLGKDSREPVRMASSKIEKGKSEANVYTSAQLSRAARVARDALNYRGASYVWGGNGRFGVFDCSGFTQYLYAKKGVKLPHSAKLQFKMGSLVDRCDLKDGDLVFFNTARGPLTHVGMYIGDGKFIHAANPRRGVVTSNLSGAYYGKRYAGARRFAS